VDIDIVSVFWDKYQVIMKEKSKKVGNGIHDLKGVEFWRKKI